MTTAAARKARERAEKALEQITSVNREREGYATGRKNGEFYKGPHMDVDAVMKGVTVGWLAQAFNFNHDQVKKKLRDCPPLYRKKEGFIYDLRTAVPYLIKPVFNIEEYLRNARIEDLPLRLQTEFWAASNKRREYEEATGKLWRSEDVFEVLGGVFQMMKNTLLMWVSDMERQHALTEIQRKFLKERVEALQDKLYQELVTMASNPRTKSVRQHDSDAEALEAAKMIKVTDDTEEETDDEYDFTHLI